MTKFSLYYYIMNYTVFDYLFQDPSTELAQSLINLHHWILFYIIVTCIFVFYLLLRILKLFAWYNFKELEFSFFYNFIEKFYSNEQILFWLSSKLLIKNSTVWYSLYSKFEVLDISGLSEHTVLEIIWTLIPSIIIIWILIPSFILLYSVDSVLNPLITVIVIGHQWYWSYEISETSLFFENLNVLRNLNFDSNLLKGEDLSFGTHRLLEVNNRLILPVGIPLRFLITSGDVLHSWAVPEMGIKVDAVPGRLNQIVVEIKRPGIFYGQCSELCGVEHGFMPIVVHALPLESYLNWLEF